MSADNWGFCPKCMKQHVKYLEELKKNVEQSYGKVSAEDYLLLTEKLNNPDKPKDTLREDYDLGISEEKFYVSYRASCKVCGFTFSFSTIKELSEKL